MAKFIVSIPIAGSATFEVEASDAKTAKEAAWEAVNGHCEPEVAVRALRAHREKVGR